MGIMRITNSIYFVRNERQLRKKSFYMMIMFIILRLRRTFLLGKVVWESQSIRKGEMGGLFYFQQSARVDLQRNDSEVSSSRIFHCL